MINNHTPISYEKVYADDSGKKMVDIFGGDSDMITIKTLWNTVIDGFVAHDNTRIAITVISGNIRIVVVDNDVDTNYKFKQYFLSALDGKILKLQPNTKYAIQNMDEGKSTYALGSDDTPNIKFTPKSIFNWRRKQS